MKDEQTNFKVTDRRLFNADGTPRDIPPDERPLETPRVEETTRPGVLSSSAPAGGAATAKTATEKPEPSRAGTAEEPELPGADDPASFLSFLMSIASNAASALGMMEHPITHKREVDLELGKHWIDVLGMLQQKTRGNLVPQEQQMLEGLLSDLRLQYVSLANSSTPKAARTYTGSDITGGK